MQMPEKSKKNLIFNWLAKGTRAEPWTPAREIIESDDFKELQEIGKQLVQNSRKKAQKAEKEK